MYFIHIMQGETPLSMASRAPSRRDPGVDVQGANDSTASRREVQKTKVVQSDLACGFLVRRPGTTQFSLYLCELPTVLFGCADVTGRTLKSCMEKLLSFPLLEGLLLRFPLCLDIAGSDRAASNMLMDKLFKQQKLFTPRLCGLVCQEHMLHTIQGRVFGILKPCVSGCINLEIAEQPAGSTSLLRQAIKEVLKASANVYVGALPPARDTPSMVHRHHIFDLVLGNSLSDRKRRAILESTLQGGPSQDRIDVYLPVVPPDEIPARLDAWATRVSWALLPRRHPVFCRHRRVTGQETSAGPALLACCHRLLSRSVPVWLRLMGRRVPQAAGTSDAAGVAEPQQGDFELQLVGQDPQPIAADVDKSRVWSAENERARVNALQFAMSEPAVHLVVLLVTMRPLVSMLDRLLEQVGFGASLQRARDGAPPVTGRSTKRTGVSSGGVANRCPASGIG